jgi:hypothetical protein
MTEQMRKMADSERGVGYGTENMSAIWNFIISNLNGILMKICVIDFE